MPFVLSVVTPESPLVESEVQDVVLPGAEGEFGVLPDHEALLAPLQAGVLSYRAGGTVKRLELGGGFAEVTRERVTVLADSARPVS